MSGCSSPRDFFLTARQRWASGSAWLALPAPLSSATSDVRQLKVSGWCSPDTDWYTCSMSTPSTRRCKATIATVCVLCSTCLTTPQRRGHAGLSCTRQPGWQAPHAANCTTHARRPHL